MSNLHQRRIAGNLVFWDQHQRRLIDAIGPGVVKYIHDFIRSPLAAADAPLGATITLVEAGNGDSTVTMPDAGGGALLLTADNNDNDGISMQLDGEAFEMSSSQAATYFRARLKLSEATQSDFLVGLCITDATLLGGMSDGAYFEKLDGGTGISCTTEKDSTETQTDLVHTLAADTYVDLEIYFDGASVEFFVDGASVAKHTTNIPDNEGLTLSLEFLAGTTGGMTCTLSKWTAIQINK